MATLINLPNSRCDLKFGAKATSFKKVKKFNYKKNFFKLYIDKNDSVYDIKRCEVVSWKANNKKKVPDEIKEVRDLHLFDKVKGNPSKIAITKIAAEIDMLSLI